MVKPNKAGLPENLEKKKSREKEKYLSLITNNCGSIYQTKAKCFKFLHQWKRNPVLSLVRDFIVSINFLKRKKQGN